MSQSYLIYGNNQKSRKKAVIEVINKKTGLKNDLKKWNEHPDVKIVSKKKNKKSIGIDQVRQAISYLNERPFSLKIKFLVIPKAYLLTTQAQNALLKTLEEPPLYADIFLLTKTRDDLLQTIISRCKIVTLKGINNEESNYVLETEDENNINKVLKMKTGKRLDWAYEFSKEDQEYIIQTLENWILILHNKLVNDNIEVNIYSNIRLIIKVKEDISNTNVNKALALKNLVLHLQ